ncbi:hypothetical protein [Neosynechococcus sphagnicola]|nr:hypothetical protein [Neosynechococcus sphagnicola]
MNLFYLAPEVVKASAVPIMLVVPAAATARTKVPAHPGLPLLRS